MTSEEEFKLPKQPNETCPMIDSIVKKINSIEKLAFRYENCDDDELKSRLSEIECLISGVEDKLEEIRRHTEAIRSWGQAWKEKAFEYINQDN